MNFVRIIPLFVLATVAGAASAQQVTLRFKPPVGKTYNYTSSLEMSGGGPGQQSSKQSSTTQLKIGARTGDKTRVTMTNTNVVKSGKSGAKDSPMQMDITSLNAVTSLNSNGKAQIAILGGEMMSAMGPFPPFPANPVGVGSTWKKEFDLSKMFGKQFPPGVKISGGKLPLMLKLVKFVNQGGKKLAQISINGKAAATISQSAMPAGGAKTPAITMTIAVICNTTTMVDVATGVGTDLTASMAFNVKIGTQPPMKQTMKMSMRAK